MLLLCIFSFSSSGTTMTVGDGGYGRETWTRVIDVVPPDTKLKDVRARIQAYLRDEKVVQPK